MNHPKHIFKGNKNYKSIVIGTAKVLRHNTFRIPKYPIKDIDQEIKQLKQAIQFAKQDVEALQSKVHPEKEKDIYAIFDFYKLYLEDDSHIIDVIEDIKNQGLNAAYIIMERHKKTMEAFDKIEDPKMRERKEDIEFLTHKVLNYLLHQEESPKSIAQQDLHASIIFAEKISPMDLILYYHQGVKAIVTEEGTFTSHTSIIANTLDISYMMGIDDCLDYVENKDQIIVDGFTGEIFVNPDLESLSQYKKKKKEQIKLLDELENEAITKSYTKDQHHIKIMSNIDIIDAPKEIHKYNFEGIGLARSEFMFHDIDTLPSVEEQYNIYKELLLKNKDVEVTIRTFDFSEDKTPNALKVFKQHNPSIGLRGIRFSLYQGIFKEQFKALIKASEYGQLKILFPMITSVEEFLKIQAIEQELLQELQIKKTYKLGIMIETIASLYMLDYIHQDLDFVSLGTNDLMQYFFAVDRSNRFVKDLSSPFVPTFITFLQDLSQKIKKTDLELSICGKIASMPMVIPILLGLELKTLSISPLSFPIVKRVIKQLSYQDSKALIKRLTQNKTMEENENCINQFLKAHQIEL